MIIDISKIKDVPKNTLLLVPEKLVINLYGGETITPEITPIFTSYSELGYSFFNDLKIKTSSIKNMIINDEWICKNP